MWGVWGTSARTKRSRWRGPWSVGSTATGGAWSLFFFFSSRRRHTRLQGDWSSDVCSSDLDDDRRTQLGRPGDRGSQVANLDVEGDPAPIALAKVPARPWLRSPDAGRNLHDRTVADLPIEQGGVERPLSTGLNRLDLPVHDGPRPVISHESPSAVWPRPPYSPWHDAGAPDDDRPSSRRVGGPGSAACRRGGVRLRSGAGAD